MNSKSIAVALVCLVLCGYVRGAEDMDTELTKITEKLAVPIKDKGMKKVTVLDFTDLQGSGTELGKYVAEQITVDLVLEKRDFSVLDRANLKSILAEHKLTAKGLIDPETAKKLGMFAGVDALILGTITPKGSNMSLTAKIITTETAEIIGAAKGEFRTNDTVQELLSHAATSGAAGDSEPPAKKPFADLKVTAESLRLAPGANPYTMSTLTLIITNMSSSLSYGVALKPNFYRDFNLSNSRGDVFDANDVKGIGTLAETFAGLSGNFTSIPPNSSIIVIATGQCRESGSGKYRPFRLSTIVYYGTESQGRVQDVKQYNLVMDIK